VLEVLDNCNSNRIKYFIRLGIKTYQLARFYAPLQNMSNDENISFFLKIFLHSHFKVKYRASNDTGREFTLNLKISCANEYNNIPFLQKKGIKMFL